MKEDIELLILAQERSQALERQLVDLNHAIDVYWNGGRTMHDEKYLCFQQKKTFEVLSCKECKKYPCNCNEPF